MIIEWTDGAREVPGIGLMATGDVREVDEDTGRSLIGQKQAIEVKGTEGQKVGGLEDKKVGKTESKEDGPNVPIPPPPSGVKKKRIKNQSKLDED